MHKEQTPVISNPSGLACGLAVRNLPGARIVLRGFLPDRQAGLVTPSGRFPRNDSRAIERFPFLLGSRRGNDQSLMTSYPITNKK